MQEIIKRYSRKTQEIAKIHRISHKETLKLVEALLEKYPKLYEFLVIDRDIERALKSYLEKYHPEVLGCYDNYLFFIEEKELTARKLLSVACEVLGIVIAAAIRSKFAPKYSNECILYLHKDTWMLDLERQNQAQKALDQDLDLSPRRPKSS